MCLATSPGKLKALLPVKADLDAGALKFLAEVGFALWGTATCAGHMIPPSFP